MTSPGPEVGRNALDSGNSPVLIILSTFILDQYNINLTETLVVSVQYYKTVDKLHTKQLLFAPPLLKTMYFQLQRVPLSGCIDSTRAPSFVPSMSRLFYYMALFADLRK